MKPVNRMLSDKWTEQIEQKYSAKYVIDTCIKNVQGNWTNFPAAIFYTDKKHPNGSNYMALFKHYGDHLEWMITDGFEAVQGEFHGLIFGDGELMHSRYRHDYFEHRCSMVDGGRDYFRFSPDPDTARRVIFKIVDGNIVEVTE